MKTCKDVRLAKDLRPGDVVCARAPGLQFAVRRIVKFLKTNDSKPGWIQITFVNGLTLWCKEDEEAPV